jgi:hypothetical protein
MKRKTYSYITLLSELKICPRDWHNYLRTNKETYLNLSSLLTPLIKKQGVIMREACQACSYVCSHFKEAGCRGGVYEHDNEGDISTECDKVTECRNTARNDLLHSILSTPIVI